VEKTSYRCISFATYHWQLASFVT